MGETSICRMHESGNAASHGYRLYPVKLSACRTNAVLSVITKLVCEALAAVMMPKHGGPRPELE